MVGHQSRHEEWNEGREEWRLVANMAPEICLTWSAVAEQCKSGAAIEHPPPGLLQGCDLELLIGTSST